MKSRWPIAVVLAATWLLYLVYPTRTHECDAVYYASAALGGDRAMMYYPAHLGFGPLEALVATAARHGNPPWSPILLLQYLSMAAALIGLLAFHRTLEDLDVPPARAALGAATLGASYAFWHFALQAESHMPSTALLLLCLWRAIPMVRAPSAGRAAAVGLLLGAATLTHQRNLVLAPAVPLALAFTAHPAAARVRAAAAFAGAFAALAVVAFLMVAWGPLHLRDPAAILLWLRGLSVRGGWGQWTSNVLPATGVGLVRSLAGSHFLLAYDAILALAHHLFPRASLEDEIAVARAVPAPLVAMLAALEAGVLAAAAVAVLRGATRVRALLAADRPVVVLMLGWLAITFGFVVWWAPVRAEFWIDVFPPALVLLALPLARAHGSPAAPERARPALAFVVALALVNLLGSIRPQSLSTTDHETEVAIEIEAAVPTGAALLADLPFQGRASRYVFGFSTLDLLEGVSPDTLRAAFEAAGGVTAAFERAVAPTLRRVDSTLADAAARGVPAYLLATPVSESPARRAAYGWMVAALGPRRAGARPVPVRGGVELRRLRVPSGP